jgi:hypothetical protein
MTGDDQALPWTGVFHFTFCSSLQRRGRLVEAEVPSPFGPRNSGQLFSAAPSCKAIKAANKSVMRM